jgi:multicomponent Na+:H+ antiporter subunit D
LSSSSFLALAQTKLRRMLCYLIIAEVGYMVGGAWLANYHGMVGAIYHIVSDAFMTLCMFLAVGILFKESSPIDGFKGMFKRKPWTMAAFILGALSLIGVPPTCGFFSKYYLIRGGIEAGRWEFVIALLFSSLINVILFFRIIEKGFFHLDGGHHDEHGEKDEAPDDPTPLSQAIPLWVVATSLILLGLFNQQIAGWIGETLQAFPIIGGQG